MIKKKYTCRLYNYLHNLLESLCIEKTILIIKYHLNICKNRKINSSQMSLEFQSFLTVDQISGPICFIEFLLHLTVF